MPKKTFKNFTTNTSKKIDEMFAAKEKEILTI